MCRVGIRIEATLAIAIAALSVCNSYAEEPKVNLPCEMRRECRQLATDNGATAVAVEMYVGRYESNANSTIARRDCKELDISHRYRIPECVTIEEFDARRAGDLDARAALSEEGFNREKTRTRVKVTAEELRQMLSRFSEIRFAFKASWDHYLSITYVMYGEMEEFAWTVELKWIGERYWLTEEITLNHIIHPLLSAYLTGNGAPFCGDDPFTHTIRVSLDQATPPEKRKILLEPALGGLPEDSRSVVLLLNINERVVPDGVAVEGLAGGDRVERALATAISTYSSQDATAQELLQVWHPENRKKVEEDFRRLQNTKYRLVDSFMLGRNASQFRMTAKITTDDGTIVYGRVPDGMGEPKLKAVALRPTAGQYRLAHDLPNAALNQILTDPAIVSYFASLQSTSR